MSDAKKAGAAPTQDKPQVGSRISGEGERVVVIGRGGEQLTRKRTITSDIFHVPPEVIPENFDYQWNVMEVTGQPQVAARLSMAENGWRPVPAGRHPGLFMPAGTPADAPIIRDGLILEERPMALTEEARAEELAKARRQVKDQNEQLRLSAKLPAGFSDDPVYRGTGAMARQTIGPAPDAPRPQLQIDAGG